LALTEARSYLRDLINKAPNDTSNEKNVINTLKMKYYLNFVSYLFLNAQNTSEMVAMLENKNILKKMVCRNITPNEIEAIFSYHNQPVYYDRL
jgi:hypothetical protein